MTKAIIVQLLSIELLFSRLMNVLRSGVEWNVEDCITDRYADNDIHVPVVEAE